MRQDGFLFSLSTLKLPGQDGNEAASDIHASHHQQGRRPHLQQDVCRSVLLRPEYPVRASILLTCKAMASVWTPSAQMV